MPLCCQCCRYFRHMSSVAGVSYFHCLLETHGPFKVLLSAYKRNVLLAGYCLSSHESRLPFKVAMFLKVVLQLYPRWDHSKE